MFLLKSTAAYNLTWLSNFAEEGATLAFYCVTGWMFRPIVDNPYLNEDELELEDIEAIVEEGVEAERVGGFSPRRRGELSGFVDPRGVAFTDAHSPARTCVFVSALRPVRDERTHSLYRFTTVERRPIRPLFGLVGVYFRSSRQSSGLMKIPASPSASPRRSPIVERGRCSSRSATPRFAPPRSALSRPPPSPRAKARASSPRPRSAA